MKEMTNYQLKISDLSFHYESSASDLFDFEKKDEILDPQEKPGIPSLENIDFSINKGECILITGPSGCGKTTFLHTINGIVPEFFPGNLCGKITFEGRKIGEVPPEERGRLIGSIFQNPRSQFFNVMVKDELRFGCENLNLPQSEIQSRLDALIKEFQVENLLSKNLFHLSGGEKQRIACLSIAAMNPRLILYDEPSSNLDTAGMDSLRNIMMADKKLGVTQIISEHRLSYLGGLVDRVLIMDHGKIQEVLNAEEFEALSHHDLCSRGLRSNKQVNFPVPSSFLPLHKRSDARYRQNTEDLYIEKLFLQYKNTSSPVLDVENQTFQRGKIHVLLGQNGIGKTSFLRALTGIEKRARGKITYKNQSYKPKTFCNLCSIVFQDVNHQLIARSVREELALSLEGQNLSLTERENLIADISEDLELQNHLDCHPFTLSGGQKQRLALGTVILMNRPILILDEPTSGLDLHHMKSISRILNGFCSNRIILLATHDAELIATLNPIVHQLEQC